MMALNTQIVTLFFSFLYGVFFEITLLLSIKIIYNSKYIIRFIGTGLFVMFHTLLYFILVQRINQGIIHIYSVLCLIGGFIVGSAIHKIIKNRFTLLKRK